MSKLEIDFDDGEILDETSHQALSNNSLKDFVYLWEAFKGGKSMLIFRWSGNMLVKFFVFLLINFSNVNFTSPFVISRACVQDHFSVICRQ